MSKTIEVDTKTFVRFWLVIVGLALVGLLIFMALDGIIVVLTSIFFAVALRPLAKHIDNIDKKKERRGFSSVASVLIVVFSIIAVILFAGPVIVNETSKFLAAAPEQVTNFLNSSELDDFGRSIGIPDLDDQIIASVKDMTSSFASGLSGFALSSIGTIGSIATATVLIIVLTILFMLQGPELLDKFWASLSGRNQKASEVWRRITGRMADVISKYVSGQLLVAILDGVVVAVSILTLSILFGFSANLAIPMGLIAAFFYLIPMFGPIITAILVTLLLIPNSIWGAIAFLVFYIIYAQVENNLISPKIQGKGMSLPPLLILVSVTIGVYSLGLIGCVIAIPVAGCIKVFIEEYPKLKELTEN